MKPKVQSLMDQSRYNKHAEQRQSRNEMEIDPSSRAAERKREKESSSQTEHRVKQEEREKRVIKVVVCGKGLFLIARAPSASFKSKKK